MAFSESIEEIDKLLFPSITITEVFKCILHQRGEDLALDAVARMEQGKVVPLDSSLAIDATQYGVDLKCH